METKEYFEKVMQHYFLPLRRTILLEVSSVLRMLPHNLYLCPCPIAEEKTLPTGWQVTNLVLQSPDGDSIEIKSNNLFVVAELLRKIS